MPQSLISKMWFLVAVNGMVTILRRPVLGNRNGGAVKRSISLWQRLGVGNGVKMLTAAATKKRLTRSGTMENTAKEFHQPKRFMTVAMETANGRREKRE
jgi:hypothetical protein